MKLLKVLLFVVLCFAGFGGSACLCDTGQQSYAEALQALRAGDAAKAVELFSQAISLNNGEPRYYNDRGVAYKRLGSLDMALSDYTEAIRLRPSYTHALNNRGLVYLEQGKYDQAIADFSEALKHGELQSRIYTNMGLVKAKQGDHQGAIKDFDRAFSYQPMDHRSFVFMAESLEKTGDLAKALRTYHLARGLLNDPDAIALIEGRINQLEGQKGVQPQSASQLGATGQEVSKERPRPQVREIARAQPFPDMSPTQRQGVQQRPNIVIDSYETLNEISRNKAMTKYSPVAREIYRQGQEFLSKSDTTKALVRFEDARQIERRNKNVYAVAWSYIEISRVHTKLGDHVRAENYLHDALKLFESLKAEDQVILTLVELAGNSKNIGQKEKASSLYEKAREKATVLGYDVLAQHIADLATGKKIAQEKKKPVEVSKHQQVSGKIQTEVPVRGASVNARDKASRPDEAAPKPSPAASLPPSAQSAVPGKPNSSQKPSVQEKRSGTPSSVTEPTKASVQAPLIFREDGKASPAPSHGSVAAGKAVPGRGAREQGAIDGTASVKQPSTLSRGPSAGPSKKTEDQEHAQLPAPPAAKHRALANQTHLAKLAEISAKTKKVLPKEPSRQDDIVLLRDLKKKNDEQQMVPVLERLGRRYFETGNFEKSVHAYTAAIALREKLAMPDGMEALLEARASSRENLGKLAEAFEDLARSIYLLQKRRMQPDQNLTDRLKKLSTALGIDRDSTLIAFQLLWNCRSSNDTEGETRALLSIASAYDRAGRYVQALVYYDRAAASVTANRAQIFEKMGDERLAEQQWSQALDALRNLDYSGYIHIMKRSKVLGAHAPR